MGRGLAEVTVGISERGVEALGWARKLGRRRVRLGCWEKGWGLGLKGAFEGWRNGAVVKAVVVADWGRVGDGVESAEHSLDGEREKLPSREVCLGAMGEGVWGRALDWMAEVGHEGSCWVSGCGYLEAVLAADGYAWAGSAWGVLIEDEAGWLMLGWDGVGRLRRWRATAGLAGTAENWIRQSARQLGLGSEAGEIKVYGRVGTGGIKVPEAITYGGGRLRMERAGPEGLAYRLLNVGAGGLLERLQASVLEGRLPGVGRSGVYGGPEWVVRAYRERARERSYRRGYRNGIGLMLASSIVWALNACVLMQPSGEVEMSVAEDREWYGRWAAAVAEVERRREGRLVVGEACALWRELEAVAAVEHVRWTRAGGGGYAVEVGALAKDGAGRAALVEALEAGGIEGVDLAQAGENRLSAMGQYQPWGR